jgi:hypothetical protein
MRVSSFGGFSREIVHRTSEWAGTLNMGGELSAEGWRARSRRVAVGSSGSKLSTLDPRLLHVFGCALGANLG